MRDALPTISVNSASTKCRLKRHFDFRRVWVFGRREQRDHIATSTFLDPRHDHDGHFFANHVSDRRQWHIICDCQCSFERQDGCPRWWIPARCQVAVEYVVCFSSHFDVRHCVSSAGCFSLRMDDFCFHPAVVGRLELCLLLCLHVVCFVNCARTVFSHDEAQFRRENFEVLILSEVLTEAAAVLHRP